MPKKFKLVYNNEIILDNLSPTDFEIGRGYDLLTNNKLLNSNIRLECYNHSRLPEGYTELEWVQSTGTQYVNLNLSQNTAYVYMATISDIVYVQRRGVFGGLGHYSWALTCYNDTLRWCMNNGCYDSDVSYTEKHTYEAGLNFLKVDGKSMSYKTDSNTGTTGIYIGAGTDGACACKIYEFIITQNNNKITWLFKM